MINIKHAKHVVLFGNKRTSDSPLVTCNNKHHNNFINRQIACIDIICVCGLVVANWHSARNVKDRDRSGQTNNL